MTIPGRRAPAFPRLLAEPGDRAPATPPQRSYWNVHARAPSLEREHQEVTWRLKGDLDGAALRAAVEQLSARQEAFRARFELEHDQLWQIIDPSLGIALTEQDARDGSADCRLREWRLQRTDLERGPLARTTLIRCGDREWLFAFVAHHIVFDGLSYLPLATEIWELYSAAVERRAPNVPALALRLSDFLRWKRQILDTDAGREQTAFWRELMTGYQPVALPTDRPRTQVDERLAANPSSESRAGCLPVVFPQRFRDSIKLLSIKARVTRSIVMLGAFLETLHRWTGQKDLQILSGYAGRDDEALARLVGLFLNFMPLRLQVVDDVPVTEMLAALQRRVLVLRGAASVPVLGSAVVHSPLMNRINFNYLPDDNFLWSSAASRAPGLAITIEPDREWTTCMHDVGMFINDGGGSVIFNAELFDEATVRRLVDDFVALGDAMAARPSSRLLDL